jgi:hypothetical protein
MRFMVDCTSRVKEAPIIFTAFPRYSATVRFDLADDAPFFLTRFTFIGSGVFARGICSSTTYAGNDESTWGTASVERVAIGATGGGFKEGGGGGLASSGISPSFSTAKGSEGMTDAESRSRLG